MGMGVAFEIVANGQTIITAYQHWGANTDKALNELYKAVDIVEAFEDLDFETQAKYLSFCFSRRFFEDYNKIKDLSKLGYIPKEFIERNEYLREHPEDIYTRVEFGKQEYIGLDGFVSIDLSSRTFTFDVYDKWEGVKPYFWYSDQVVRNENIPFEDIHKFVKEHKSINNTQAFTLNSKQGLYCSKLY